MQLLKFNPDLKVIKLENKYKKNKNENKLESEII